MNKLALFCGIYIGHNVHLTLLVNKIYKNCAGSQQFKLMNIACVLEGDRETLYDIDIKLY
jgi:hypothetical protein